MPVMPRESKDWTNDDLDRLPGDDGLQYELLDGVLIVSPGPVMRHQRVAGRMYLLMAPSCPPELEVLFAPFDYRPDHRTSLQPDVFVFYRKDAQERYLEAPLVVAVEVLSPSTRSKDLVWKREKYERSGVVHYWIVDPAEPSILALELRAGTYEEAGRASGEQTLRLERPYPVTVTPADLISGGPLPDEMPWWGQEPTL